jgi:hypothetical protein
VDRFRREGEAGEDGRLKQGGVARLCLTMMSEVPDTKAGDAAARFTTDCNFMIQCKAPEASAPEGPLYRPSMAELWAGWQGAALKRRL